MQRRANQLLHIGMNAFFTITMRIVPVMDEGAHITSLHQVILSVIACTAEVEVHQMRPSLTTC